MALSNKTAKALKDSAHGKELIEHIKNTILSLDSLIGIDFSDKEAAAIEGKARELARDKLVDIFNPLVNTQDFDIIKDKRDDFSVDAE